MANSDFVMDFADINSKTYTKEEHDDRRCKYKIRKLNKNGTTIYIWYRICFCGKFANRDQEYDNRSTHTKDGVDAHYEESCTYETIAVHGMCWVKYYEIHVQCYCLGKPKYRR